LFTSTNFSDGGTFGSFQQLLRAANFGVLSASDYGSVTCGANPYLPLGGFSELHVDTVEEIVPEAVCDDGYSAGTESENDTPREVGSPDLFVEDNRSHNTTVNDDYLLVSLTVLESKSSCLVVISIKVILLLVLMTQI
jgi:hypothetical protein